MVVDYQMQPSLTGSTNNTIVTVTGTNEIQGESNLQFDDTFNRNRDSIDRLL